MSNYNFGDYIEPGYVSRGGHMDSLAYAQALDSLVVACVDIAPVFEGKLLLGKRTRHPQADWFIFGGRMKTGEHVNDSARRLMGFEMGLEVTDERFSYLTTFVAAWSKRAHHPEDHGTHTSSFTLSIQLTQEELNAIRLNDEYSEMKLVSADNIINEQTTYHPAIVQCAHALSEKGLL